MKSKLTAGKLLAIIFCIVAAAVMCLLLTVNIYLGGQMKTIDKYLKAVSRDDFTSYTQCFTEKISANLTEADMAEDKSMSEQLENPEEFKASAKFKDRKRLENGKYCVIFDLTVYNDDEDIVINDVTKTLVRDGGKWLIES